MKRRILISPGADMAGFIARALSRDHDNEIRHS